MRRHRFAFALFELIKRTMGFVFVEFKVLVGRQFAVLLASLARALPATWGCLIVPLETELKFA